MNPLIQKFGEEKRWVNWKLEMVKGKMTKVPYQPNGRHADATDSATWSTYQEVTGQEKRGFMAGLDQSVLLIDIDHCLEGNIIVHEEKQQIAELIIESDTYTEISPSGTGLHLYFKLSAPLSLVCHRKKPHPYEVYADKRFFTVTGISYKEERDIRTITPQQALELLSIIGFPWGNKPIPQSAKSSSVQNLDDDTLLKKMFKAKNGDKAEALYNGDISAYFGDISAADMGLCARLAFWTGKNAEQMDRIWTASPLGQREKTQKRKVNYRGVTIAKAIANCKEIYESRSMKIEKENPKLDLMFAMVKGEKVFIQNLENMCRILRQHDRFRYDIFKNTMEFRGDHGWRNLEDHDTLNIQTEISILYPCFAKVGKDMVGDAIMKVSKENTIDSAVDYITSIKWDNVARLDSWLSQTYNTPDDEYHKKAGANWFKGLVKRIIHPGCKFDYVLVLEGEQGIRKSTSLGVIGGSWHVETTMSTDNKDFYMQFQGKAIIEFSEGQTISQTDVRKMKAIITMQSDKYRPAYGRLSVDFPRRCVFAMTTNKDQYLKDDTGNRRWLPVACVGDVNIGWITENRDQLYAEAYERVINLKETTWEFPIEETLRVQNERRIQDPNADLVSDWFFNKLTQTQRNEGATIHQAYRDALHGGMSSKPLDRWTEMSIADIYKTILNLEVRKKMINGLRANRWFVKGSPEIMFTTEPPQDSLDELVEDLTTKEIKF